jgi:FkbM family methyltransferase
MNHKKRRTTASRRLLKPVKIFIDFFLKFLGLKLNRIKTLPILNLGVDYVIDVGAYTGVFALELRKRGYAGEIYSFEPLNSAYTELIRNASTDEKWQVHAPVALGSKKGKSRIFVSANPTSSSLKQILDSHLEAASYAYTAGEQNVEVITLDSMYTKWKNIGKRIYLKIDCQGFEEEILKGANKTLKLIDVVQIELSIIKLYKNQENYKYFIDFFDSRGFILYDLIPGFSNARTGQLLQFDGIFVRKNFIRSITKSINSISN